MRLQVSATPTVSPTFSQAPVPAPVAAPVTPPVAAPVDSPVAALTPAPESIFTFLLSVLQIVASILDGLFELLLGIFGREKNGRKVPRARMVTLSQIVSCMDGERLADSYLVLTCLHV